MRGFTLIELLVVLLILASATAIVVPMFDPASPGAQVKSDVSALSAFLREARSDAIASNRDVLVTISTDTKTYMSRNPMRKGTLKSDAKLSMITAKIEQVDRTTGGFRFFPDGSSTGGEIHIDADSERYVIKIEWLTGRVSVTP